MDTGNLNVPAFLSVTGVQPVSIVVQFGLVITWIVIVMKFYKNAWEGKPAYQLVLVHDLWLATGVGLALTITIHLPGAMSQMAVAARKTEAALVDPGTGLGAIYAKVAALELRTADVNDLREQIRRLSEENVTLRRQLSEGPTQNAQPSQGAQEALAETAEIIHRQCHNFDYPGGAIGLLQERIGPHLSP